MSVEGSARAEGADRVERSELGDPSASAEPAERADPSGAAPPADGSQGAEPADGSAGASVWRMGWAFWRYALRRITIEFGQDRVTELAAALTYRSVMAIFPAAIVLLSLLGLFGQGQATVDAVMKVVTRLGGSGLADTVRPIVSSVSGGGGAGVTFGLGLVVGLWSASGYVAAFGRALNQVWEVDEGRPAWQLRPLMFLVTIATVALAAVTALTLVLSGGVAEAIGEAMGLGSTTVRVWGIVKWPVLLVLVILNVALLYWATPNIKAPRFRILSLGAVVAILLWIAVSVGFGFYVGNFASYNKTYGSLAGAIIFLLWLWLTNVALLLGAEVDAELERARELSAGIEAEREIGLLPRGTRTLPKKRAKAEEIVERGRALREGR